jgi:DNA-binding transcriptional ArsR family regulator
MDLNTAANALRELATRHVSKLYRAGQGGSRSLPVGELQKHLEIPASTLSHHLSVPDIR